MTSNRVIGGGDADAVFDIAVVGRGPVGAALALALAQAGFRTACVGPGSAVHASTSGGTQFSPAAALTAQAFDPRQADPTRPAADVDWDPRVYALSPATRRLLSTLRVWDALDAARVAPVYDMRVYPGPAALGAPELHFDAYQARVDALAWIVEGRNLAATLERALSFSQVKLFDASLSGIDADRGPSVVASLDSGQRVAARLLVGADGAQSLTRRLSDIEARVHDYPQTAVVANFAIDAPHRDTARQWFGAHGVLALLPLPGPYASMVWSAPHALAAELMALPPIELPGRVAQVAGAAFAGLRTLGPPQAFPLKRVDCGTLIAPRLALVGDAAHVVHPLAGQGMNLGFGDVAALADVLGHRRPYRDPGDRLVLRRYERARREAVAAMRLTTDALQRLFDDEALTRLGALAGPVAIARDAGWRLVAASGWLRRQLIEAAASA